MTARNGRTVRHHPWSLLTTPGSVLSHPLAAMATLFLLVTTLCVGCDENHVDSRRIPGTEHMESNGSKAWFSVSPDDQWLAFMEVDSIAPPREHDDVQTYHFVTMNLRSGAKTHHRLDQVPDSLFRHYGPPWQELKNCFEVDQWAGSDFYFMLYWHHRANDVWLRVSPGEPSVTVASPRGDLRCSDCPPTELLTLRLDEQKGKRSNRAYAHDADGDRLNIPYREGQASPFIYKVGSTRRDTIVRIDSTGSEVVVLKLRRGWWKKHFVRIRVSPDERYIAYVIEETSRIPFPFSGRCEVYLKDRMTGRTAQVRDDYNYVSAILWSSDSQRFYYAAIDYDESGIYLVNMKDDQASRGVTNWKNAIATS